MSISVVLLLLLFEGLLWLLWLFLLDDRLVRVLEPTTIFDFILEADSFFICSIEVVGSV